MCRAYRDQSVSRAMHGPVVGKPLAGCALEIDGVPLLSGSV